MKKIITAVILLSLYIFGLVCIITNTNSKPKCARRENEYIDLFGNIGYADNCYTLHENMTCSINDTKINVASYTLNKCVEYLPQ